jgi:hypothetical protein
MVPQEILRLYLQAKGIAVEMDLAVMPMLMFNVVVVAEAHLIRGQMLHQPLVEMVVAALHHQFLAHL